MKLVIVLFVLICFNCDAQWHPLTEEGVGAIDFINDSTGMAVSNEADSVYLMKTIDYGESWDTLLSYPSTWGTLLDISFVNESLAFTCGAPNMILKTTDGGESWFDPSIDDDPYFKTILFITELIGFGAASDGSGAKIGSTYDGGQTWTILEEGGGRDIHGTYDCYIGSIAGTRYFSLSECTDPWIDDTLSTINRTWNTIHLFDEQNFFIGALGGFGTYFDFNYGSIGRTYDGGETFEILDFPYAQSVIDLHFTSELVGYAGCIPFTGYPYSILKTMDGGNTWGYQEMILDSGDNFPGIGEIDCPSPEICYAAGSNAVYRTMNAGGEIFEAWVEVGVEESKKISNAFTLYPNPASFTITLQGIPSGKKFTSSIFNSLGQIVHQASNKTEIDVASFPQGIYYLEIITEKEKGVIRWVKE